MNTSFKGGQMGYCLQFEVEAKGQKCIAFSDMLKSQCHLVAWQDNYSFLKM